MPLIPLKIPAGFYRTGTDLDGSGRWRDGSLVRWRDGSLRPVKGWRQNENIDDISENPPRGMHSWQTQDNSRFLAAGTYNELKAALASGAVYDITPSNLTSGSKDAQVNIGYGYAAYGTGIYGDPRPDTGNLVEATTWSLDNWGENLVGTSPADGRIWEWSLDTVTGSELVQNGTFDVAPTSPDWVLGTGWVYRGSPDFKVRWDKSAASAVTSLETYVFGLSSGTKYVVTLSLQDVDDSDGITPSVKIKVTGLATLTELIVDDLKVGLNTVVFESDDSSAKLEIYPNTATEEDFDIDTISVKEAVEAQQVANSPTSVGSILVTEERFIFALGCTSQDPVTGYSPRLVRWCDREDNTSWTATALNQAGEIELQTSGKIETGIRTRGQTLIITDVDAHIARYVGPPYVYGFERVGTSCGIISRKAAADVDAGTFWMGKGAFYRFDGNVVSQIPCDVHDYVFNDLNTSQRSKVWAWTNGQFSEIWWFYPSSSSTDNEIDKYVAYDYREGHWLIGELSRTSGTEQGVFEYSMLAGADGAVYDHEVGRSYLNGADQAIVYAETSAISLGNGDQIMQVTDLIPDEKTQGDVSISFKSRYYPNAEEFSHGPYTPSNPTSVRFSGRQIRMKVQGSDPYTDWNVGTMRVNAKAGGTR